MNRPVSAISAHGNAIRTARAGAGVTAAPEGSRPAALGGTKTSKEETANEKTELVEEKARPRNSGEDVTGTASDAA